ncbi:carbohydrate ABC transporter permease, partial [Thermodesulfobacteriota bacterium]
MSGTRTTQEIQRTILLKKVFKKTVLTIIIFTVAIIYFSPVLYMHLSAFKTEYDAVSPSLFFSPTLETFQKVLG